MGQHWTKRVPMCAFGRRSSGHPSAMPKRRGGGAVVRANVAVLRWRSAECCRLVVRDILPMPSSAAEGEEQFRFYGAVERGGHRFGMARRVRDLVLFRYPISEEP